MPILCALLFVPPENNFFYKYVDVFDVVPRYVYRYENTIPTTGMAIEGITIPRYCNYYNILEYILQ